MVRDDGGGGGELRFKKITGKRGAGTFGFILYIQQVYIQNLLHTHTHPISELVYLFIYTSTLLTI
jgi:hypothetical protein